VYISFLKSIILCIDRKKKDYNCFINFFITSLRSYLSSLLSESSRWLYVKFSKTHEMILTDKYYRNVFTAVAENLFVLKVSTLSNKASKSSPATVANRLSAIFNGSKHLRRVRLVHYIFSITQSFFKKSRASGRYRFLQGIMWCETD